MGLFILYGMEKRTKHALFVAVSLLGVLAIAGGSFLFYKNSQEKLISALSERQLAIAQISAHKIALELKHLHELVSIHAQSESSRLFLERWEKHNPTDEKFREAESNLLTYLDDLYTRTKKIGAFAMISAEGKIILSTDSRITGVDVTDRAYFQDAMALKESTYTPIVGRQTDTPLVSVAEAVLAQDKNTPIGVFAVYVPLSGVAQDLISSAKPAADSQLFVIDENGTVLLHENADLTLRYSMQSEEWFQDLKKHQGNSFITDWDKQKALVSISPVADTDWTVVTLSGLQTVLKPVQYFLNLILLGSLLLICLLAGIIYSIFAHKKSRALLEAKNMAESLSNAKSWFMANISHEIRTPMNAIMGLNHLLSRTNLDARQKDYVEKINAASKNLLHLINDILDFSRIETGQLELAKHAFSLETLFSSLSVLIAPSGESKKLEMLFRISPQVPMHVIGDDVRLTQVLLKLASNAIKFTEKGEIILALDGYTEDLPPDATETQKEKAPYGYAKLTFHVHDTGIGMDEEEVQSLFVPFTQADNSLTRRFGGAGFSLALAHRIVELMGGKLEVRSQKNVGSDFFFTLRLPVAPSCALEDNVLMPSLEGMRALVVDDNPAACFILREMLENMYLDVDEASSGLEAIQLVRKAYTEANPYTFVFMDWKMPGLDGAKTTMQLRQFPTESPIRIILVTGYLYEADPVYPHLFDAILQKPVNASALYNALLVCENTRTRGPRENNQPEDHPPLQGEVLLVEDNLINQLIAEELLNLHGLSPDIAQNGRDALEKFQQKTYNLVLMDIQMPEMDGLEATRRMREWEKSAGKNPVPILAMTAHALEEDKELSFNSGMDGHISKPIDPEALAHTLRQWLPLKPRES